jgi:hypothetical protein
MNTIARTFRKNYSRLSKRFSEIPIKPPNPTMEESFGALKLSDQELGKLVDPKGFLSEKEKEKYEVVDKTEAKTETVERDMKEYGFKVKGKEPTRYGDWERNGRCFDF